MSTRLQPLRRIAQFDPPPNLAKKPTAGGSSQASPDHGSGVWGYDDHDPFRGIATLNDGHPVVRLQRQERNLYPFFETSKMKRHLATFAFVMLLCTIGCSASKPTIAQQQPIQVDPLWQDQNSDEGFIYLLGDVLRSGGHWIPGPTAPRVEKLVASAGGLTEGKGQPMLTIERMVDGQKQRITIPFRSIDDPKRPLIFVKADDVITLSHQ